MKVNYAFVEDGHRINRITSHAGGEYRRKPRRLITFISRNGILMMVIARVQICFRLPLVIIVFLFLFHSILYGSFVAIEDAFNLVGMGGTTCSVSQWPLTLE